MTTSSTRGLIDSRIRRSARDTRQATRIALGSMGMSRSVLVAVIAALAWGAPVQAASLREDMVQGLIYQAEPGEVNDVELSFSGGYYFVHDSGATLTAQDAACVVLDQHEARCINTGFPWVFLNFWLGDGDDHATIVSVDESQSPDWRINGEAGDDTMSSFAIADGLISGGAGDDFIGSFFGSASGGPDSDTLDFSDSGFGRSVDLAAGTATGVGMFNTIENVLGGAGEDVLLGNAEANYLDGGGGDDLLDARAGPDELAGGDGFDVADYSERATDVTVALDGTASSGNLDDDDGMGVRDTVYPDVEDIFGGPGDDTLIGNGSDNFFDGGFGADVMRGGAGDDLVDYSSRSANVLVALDGTARSGDPADGPGDTLESIEDAVGGMSDDTILGNSAANRLFGGPGWDTLDGGPGEDLMDGEAGRDLITSRDGSVDSVVCGEDLDTATVERVDVVAQDCETIEQGPPTVGATVTSEITSNGVTLTSFVNPNRRPAVAWFQLGTTTAYGNNTTFIGPVNGNDDIPITAQVRGLLPATTYHVRMTALNGLGPAYTAYGPDTTFTTASVPTRPPPPPPPTSVRCRVPKLKGKTLVAGRRALRRANCRVGKITRAYSRAVPKGRIFRQSRRPGARLPNGAKVGVVVSRGKKPGTRPRRR
jgi:Ca2+-binding RTX toxin-like protein